MVERAQYVRKWTHLLFHLNGLIDSGEQISIAETSDHIEDGTLFEWLRELYPFQGWT
jgi:hypothetical protein